MTFDDLQAWMVTWLEGAAVTGGTLADVTVIAEDGSYPQTPGRETALNEGGLLLVVWQPESEGLEEVLQDGTTRHSVALHVVVEENQAVNRAAGGTGITAVKAVRLVMERVTGQGTGKTGRNAIEPMDPPFKNFGKVNGVNRWVVSFVKSFITRSAAIMAELTTALTGANNDLLFRAVTAGAAGNAISVRYVNPGTPSAVLSVSVAGSAITVNLATSAGSAITSTAALVKAAIEASGPAAALVRVELATGSTGAGVVTALAATNLSGGADN